MLWIISANGVTGYILSWTFPTKSCNISKLCECAFYDKKKTEGNINYSNLFLVVRLIMKEKGRQASKEKEVYRVHNNATDKARS